MTNLIFPYIGFDNPLTDKAKSVFLDCSLIYLNQKGIILEGLYSQVFHLPENIIQNIKNLERLYLEKHQYDKSFDFYSFLLNKDSSEMPEKIVSELKSGFCLEDDRKDIEKEIVLSGFFLKLFEKYESEKKSVDSSFFEIQKREQELFYSLTNEKNAINEKNIEFSENIPQNLIKKRILSWFDLYFYLEMPCLSLVTDKIEYINILSEIGFIQDNKPSDLNIFYLSEFEFLLNNSRVLQSKYRDMEKIDKRIEIKVLEH